MKQIAKAYFTYYSVYSELLKVLYAASVLLLLVAEVHQGVFPKLPLFFLLVLVQLEIFFHFKIARMHPLVSLDKVTEQNLFDSFTISAVKPFLQSSFLLKSYQHLPQVLSFLGKAGIGIAEIPMAQITQDLLARRAVDIAKQAGGTYVTSMDVMTAYLLFNEEQNKLLFTHKLKPEELMQILLWTRKQHSQEEHPEKVQKAVWGEGLGEAMVSGWTPETEKYTTDLTSVILSKVPHVLGRQEMYSQMIEALSKNQKNNVLLVGEPGVGKRNLVYLLGYESKAGELKPPLYHQKILELLVDEVIAGAQNQGELSTRLESIIAEVSHSGNIILYIPELQNIVGGTTFHLDLTGVLLPYLESGQLKIVATVTPGNYKTYIDPAKTLLGMFSIINVEEPKKEDILPMLMDRAEELENQHNVYISYKAILAAAHYGSSYSRDLVLPGSAVQLLDDASAHIAGVKGATHINNRILVGEEDILQKVQVQTGIAVSKPEGAEKDTLLHLEDKLHERLIDQQEAVSRIAEAMRRVRSGLQEQERPISFLFLGPTGVGKTETAKSLARVYYGDENAMIRLDMSEYTTDDGVRRLLGAAPGEGSEKGELTDRVNDHPSSLILLDEFEKANKQILNLFLQVLDDGRLTDNKGKTVSFQNTIIIATSNAGAEFIREAIQNKQQIDAQLQQKLLDQLQEKGIFTPELLNRFDSIVLFKPLGQAEAKQILLIILSDLSKSMKEKDISVSFDDKIIEKVIKEGINEEFGARPLRRYVQDTIEDVLAKKLLNDEITRGSSVVVSTDEKGSIVIR